MGCSPAPAMAGMSSRPNGLAVPRTAPVSTATLSEPHTAELRAVAGG